MIKVLLLEDDIIIANEIRDFLLKKEISTDIAYDGNMFFKINKLNAYEVYLLDINVPQINGLEVCKRIREINKHIPIIMLTAFGEIDDKIEAFNFGADDYLVKPFLMEELFIRIQALLRRKQNPQKEASILKVADLSIDLDNKVVQRADKLIKLTPKEFKLLVILAGANGRVLSKGQIAEELWDDNIETNENTIEVYINFLRNKLDKPFDKSLLHTKIGFGYYLKESE